MSMSIDFSLPYTDSGFPSTCASYNIHPSCLKLSSQVCPPSLTAHVFLIHVSIICFHHPPKIVRGHFQFHSSRFNVPFSHHSAVHAWSSKQSSNQSIFFLFDRESHSGLYKFIVFIVIVVDTLVETAIGGTHGPLQPSPSVIGWRSPIGQPCPVFDIVQSHSPRPCSSSLPFYCALESYSFQQLLGSWRRCCVWRRGHTRIALPFLDSLQDLIVCWGLACHLWSALFSCLWSQLEIFKICRKNLIKNTLYIATCSSVPEVYAWSSLSLFPLALSWIGNPYFNWKK